MKLRKLFLSSIFALQPSFQAKRSNMSQSLLERKWLLTDKSSSSEHSEQQPTTASTPSTDNTSDHQTNNNNDISPETNSTAQMTEKTATATPVSGSSNVPVASTSSNKLAQEIYDEFLVCKICLDGYKNPKCLDCLHTFCEACIENHVNSEPAYKKYSDYREFTCPLCRKRTQLPVGGVKKLPDNFLVSSLTEVVGRQKPSSSPFCDICKLVSKAEKEATSKCLDCTKLLCASCVALHKNTKVTSNHSLFDVEIEKEIGCKDHQDEVIRFYCEPCETCVCVLCTFNEHRDHAISQFQDVAVKYKLNIEKLLESCKQKIVLFESHLEQINKCESTIKLVEQKIRDKSMEYVQDIRDKEKELLEQLHQMYGQDCFECIDGKKELVHQVENIRNTCNISEVILLGKDIELLLLKKDVEDKLNLMNQIEARQLPPTISKNVEYQSGVVDLGYLVHQNGDPKCTNRVKVTLRARKVDSGKPSSRWLATTVDADKSDAGAPSEGKTASIKVLSGSFELAEVKEFGVQTDPALTEESEEDLQARRRRRREEIANNAPNANPGK